MSDDIDELFEIGDGKKHSDPLAASGQHPSDELNAIKSQIPVSVKFDLVALVYGCVFIGLGVFLINLRQQGMGVAMIVVGALGVLAGLATLFWKSPKVKIIQAVDSLLIAVLLFIFSASGDLDSPIIYVGLGVWMLWQTYDNFREYLMLTNLQKQRGA